MPRYTLRALLILVTALCCCGGLFHALTRFETAENVARVDWLPQTASNVSYYRSYNYTAYEFDMSEAEFRKWMWLDVQPITRPVKVRRYSLIASSRAYPGANPAAGEYEAWEAMREATVTDGLYHEHRRDDGGGVCVAYDRAKGRVFYQSNPR
jgi:hypothetical protein